MINGASVFITRHHRHHLRRFLLRGMATFDLNKQKTHFAVGVPQGHGSIHDELTELKEKATENTFPLNKLQKP